MYLMCSIIFMIQYTVSVYRFYLFSKVNIVRTLLFYIYLREKVPFLQARENFLVAIQSEQDLQCAWSNPCEYISVTVWVIR